ncbi:CreA family protein [Ralstonia insidiosa]|uniref:CREA signal peptide protein n=1 Tax=Ralstonia insidiosa TaxID=190721 RepID=A0A191ZWI4_9RALS|nr:MULTISPECIES: CreA family protein [Ralstonia]ANH72112.1 creA family protein [Ralstonia insidiosa]ANJ72469.1 CREA signal peptide protein [Ralstonia insidiosa]EPX98177.1 CREA signal peptide protein [Ralstonia sp. AU12-08]KAB0473014.1 CREA signal peptide protein [Ralstonia insidiosa]MBY4704237.1 CreA family protein [Ralstonia insidiosa]
MRPFARSPIRVLTLLLTVGTLCTTACSRAEDIGSVSTNFRITGSDKIVIEAFDDPLVQGVTCYVSRARTGGIKGTLGVAEDVSEAAVACRQVGDITFVKPLPQQDDMFTQRLSLIFKTLHVVRTVDRKRNVLVYLTYSDKVISGSPKNSVTAVPIPASQPIPVK